MRTSPLRPSAALRLAALMAVLPIVATAQQARPWPAPDATFEEPFTQLALGGVRELSNGRVIVSDPRDKIVTMLDFRAQSATRIGREGSGPGEYALPLRLLPAGGDTTLLFDAGNQRYLIVDAAGKPGRDFRMESPMTAMGPGGGAVRVGMSLARAADARGRLYYEGSAIAAGGPGQPPADTVALLRYDPAAQRHDTLGWIRIPSSNTQVSGGQANMRVTVGMANPLAPRDEWAVFADGRVAIVRSADYRIDWVMADGANRRGTPTRFTPIRITDADKREEEERRAQAMQGAVMMTATTGPGGTQRQSSVGPPPGATRQPITDWPDVKPPFRSGMASVLARPNGELWVWRTEPAGAKGRLYDVYDARGQMSHTIRVPDGQTIVGFGNGTVYTTKLDEDDLAYLQRHRLP